MTKWRELSEAFKRELGIYKAVLRDRRTPKLAKLFLWLAIGYLLMPFDLIPDFIPVLGQLDDLVIVPCLVIIALKLIPNEIIIEHRANAAHRK
jgi:uncharacterized membrane protein YkvA (DUF1232 family)